MIFHHGAAPAARATSGATTRIAIACVVLAAYFVTLVAAAGPKQTAQDMPHMMAAQETRDQKAAPAAETRFLKESDSAMDVMMKEMAVQPSGDVDRDSWQ